VCKAQRLTTFLFHFDAKEKKTTKFDNAFIYHKKKR